MVIKEKFDKDFLEGSRKNSRILNLFHYIGAITFENKNFRNNK